MRDAYVGKGTVVERRDLTAEELSNLVHDLRGSLAAMSGFVQALREDIGGSLEAESREHLDRIERNIHRMEERLDAVSDRRS